jgi:diacylglycerol kinase
MRGQGKQSLAKSFRHAIEGVAFVICCERNVRIHLAVALTVIAMGLWLSIGSVQWALIGVAISLVFAGEMLNTVVELIIDQLMPMQNTHAKHIKDVAAGAILVNALVAAFIGLLVLGPPLLGKLGLP